MEKIFLYLRPLFLLFFIGVPGWARAQSPTVTPDCCVGVGGINGLNHPTGMAVNESLGYVYLTDAGSNTLKVFSESGAPITSFGSWTGGQFKSPQDVALDGQGNIYVADNLNGQVEEFDPNYNFVASIGASQVGPPLGVWADSQGGMNKLYISGQSGSTYVVFRYDWNGSVYAEAASFGAGILSIPAGLVKRGGMVYVADSGNDCVVAFNESGNTYSAAMTFSDPADGFAPRVIRADSAGYFYVGAGNCFVFNPDFSLNHICAMGSGFCWGVLADQSGILFAGNYANNAVTEFQGCITEPSLTPTATSTPSPTSTPILAFTPTPCCQGLTSITGLNQPGGMAVDDARNVLFVADTANQVVRTYDSLTFAPGPVISQGVTVPSDVALDSDGDVYVADGAGYVKKFGPGPGYSLTTTIGSGLLSSARGIWVDGSGASATIYVTTDPGGTFNGAVARFAGGGTAYSLITPSYGVSQLTAPTGMVKVGNLLYVADSLDGRIVSFDTTQPNPTPSPVPPASGLGTIPAVRTDLAGNFYVTLVGNGVYQYDSSFNHLRVCGLPNNVWGVVVNANGNVIVSEINGASATVLQGCVAEPSPTPSYAGSSPPGTNQCFIFPSPDRGSLATVSYNMAQSGRVDLRVWNEKAELLAHVTDSKSAGVQETPFSISGFATGVYFYSLTLTYGSGQAEKLGPKKFAILH